MCLTEIYILINCFRTMNTCGTGWFVAFCGPSNIG